MGSPPENHRGIDSELAWTVARPQIEWHGVPLEHQFEIKNTDTEN